MKQVYLSSDAVNAQIVKDYLEGAGISAIVKGEYLTGAIGEIPANTYPTVWILCDDDYQTAKTLVSNYEQPLPNDQMYLSPWPCHECHETIEAQFTQCWNCGKHRLD